MGGTEKRLRPGGFREEEVEAMPRDELLALLAAACFLCVALAIATLGVRLLMRWLEHRGRRGPPEQE